MAECLFPDCGHEAAPKAMGYCHGHARQRWRGLPLAPLRPRNRSPQQYLADAALSYAEADGDEDFTRAKARLRRAAVSYAAALARGRR